MIKIIINIRKFDSVAFKDGESFSKDQSFNIESIVKLNIFLPFPHGHFNFFGQE